MLYFSFGFCVTFWHLIYVHNPQVDDVSLHQWTNFDRLKSSKDFACCRHVMFVDQRIRSLFQISYFQSHDQIFYGIAMDDGIAVRCNSSCLW